MNFGEKPGSRRGDSLKMKNQRMSKIILMAICSAPMITAAGQEKIPEYAGTQTCQVCHAQEYDYWKSSKHAGAASTNTPNRAWSKEGIGCEACHGPGQDHISSGGDAAKIVSSIDADICGQCHGSAVSDGNSWAAAYRPGMKLSNIPGLKLISVDSAKIPPQPDASRPLTYNMWLASGHSKALSAITKSDRVTPDCYGCHSAEGFLAKLKGKKVDISQKETFHALTCVACHDPHSSDNPRQLVMDPEMLCNSCHRQRAMLEGKGAKGVEDTRSLHSAVPCVSCHMTEGNHLMNVIRPDSPDLSGNRLDTCTTCHKDNNREARTKQIQDWQAWYKEAMDPLQADLKSVNAVLKENPDILNAELKAKLGDVRSNLSIIESDGSHGAHNLDYALEIMSLAASDLKEIKAAMK
jgi:predicted CXXCH cytochrome family protein